MQLKDLVKPIDQQTDEELLERLRIVRHNREVIRPAAAKRAERSSTKAARKQAASTDKLLEELTDAEREQLLAKLLAQEGNE